MSAHTDKVFRSIFTSAPDDFPGGGGFRTVACAAALRNVESRSTLRSLVESYHTQEGGGASCRQFVPFARGTNTYALTVFTPLTDSPDGRIGNFWAETQVVSINWLFQAGWDAAAAFGALSWLGPQDLSQLSQDLKPEELAPLTPGPVERLARLCELVPSDRLEALLHAVVQQSSGLRPLRLLEAQGKPARDLEEVVMLLPLTVPPTLRNMYRDGDQFRCLTLRTRCPIGGMAFGTDITGYPAAAADGLESSDGLLIDLAGRLPAPSTGDRFRRDYTEWLMGVIQEGEWDRLTHLYKQAINFPGVTFFSQYKSLLNASSRTPVAKSAEALEPPVAAPEGTVRNDPGVVEAPTPTVAPPAAVAEEPTITPVQDWQRDSTARNEVEGELWKLRESHRRQIEELVGKIGKDLAADVDNATARLVKEVASLRDGLDAKLNFEEELKKFEKKAGKHTQQQTASAGRESRSVDERFEKLERELAAVVDRLVMLEEKGEAGTEEGDTGLSVVLSSSSESLSPGLSTGPAAGGASAEGSRRPFSREGFRLFRDWLRGHRRMAWGAGIAISMAVLLALAVRWGADKVTPDLVAPTESQARKASTEALLKRAQNGKTAARLLETAALREGIAPKAHALTLAIALSHGLPMNDGLDCALLQAALRADGAVIPVVGICGRKTIDALVSAPKSECCQEFQATPIDEKKLRNCFVTDQLQLALPGAGRQVEACSGESPWRRGRIWTEKESSRALALFQGVSRNFEGDRGSELDISLRNLDPSQSPSLRENLASITLTRDEAKRVLELAWAARSGWEDHLGKLSANQLGELGQIIDKVASPEKTIQPQSGRAARADGAR